MKSCSFFGHRNTKETVELYELIKSTVLKLIKKENVTIFYFGSASIFDHLCLKVVTQLKNEYPQIERIYVRAEYPFIDQRYTNYLLQSYDNTFMPEGIEKAGKASYIERNQVMVDKSDFCVFYYDKNYSAPQKKLCKKSMGFYTPKSGTKLNYEYALKKNKNIINLFNLTPINN